MTDSKTDAGGVSRKALVLEISQAMADGKDSGGYDTLLDMYAHIALTVMERHTTVRCDGPVAWRWREQRTLNTWQVTRLEPTLDACVYEVQPLYAAPPARSDAPGDAELAKLIAGKLAEPAFANLPPTKYNEVRYLPVINVGPTAVSDWKVVLPSGREIMISDAEWKAAAPPRSDAGSDGLWRAFCEAHDKVSETEPGKARRAGFDAVLASIRTAPESTKP